MKFECTATYVATRDLTLGVNAAVALQRPLLIKGEPGTGKTLSTSYRTEDSVRGQNSARRFEHSPDRRMGDAPLGAD